MLKKSLGLLFLFLVIVLVYFLWPLLPIISAYGAKNLCSCAYVSGRTESSIVEQELGKFPRSLGTFKLNIQDSSASGSVFGLAKREAIYRKGLGCTLVIGKSKKELKSISFTSNHTPTIDSAVWPIGNYISSDISANIDIGKLYDVVNQAFIEHNEDHKQNTRAVVIVYDGQLIFERYSDEFNKDIAQLGWSMNKSVLNALVGILAEQGKLNVHEQAPVPAWSSTDDPRHAITIDQLLRMSSGLEWEENYGSVSTATNMLFNAEDAAASAASVSLEYVPDTFFEYSSGSSNILSNIIRKKTGGDYLSFPHRELFDKIGMRSMVWELDPSDNYVASSYGYATPRDWAKFGLLYYNDGIWQGERILPEGWVKYSSTLTSTDSTGSYGAHFWLNEVNLKNKRTKRMSGVPSDAFSAEGFEGQRVIIIPSKKLVIVRMGLSARNDFDFNKFTSEIIDTVK